MSVSIILAILAVVGVIAYVAYRADQQRREAMLALAQRLGFAFERDAIYDPAWPYEAFGLFDRGHSRCAYNTISGTMSIEGRGFPVFTGDFQYKETSGTGKDRKTTTYDFSYLLVELPFRPLPSLVIRPENFFDKIAGAIGFPDINFESAEFSRCFHVKSPDARFAYDLIDPRMMEFLMATPPLPIHLEGRAICISNDGGRWKPEQFERQLDFVQQFISRWPDHVVRTIETSGVIR
jgi:hypothetical protein